MIDNAFFLVLFFIVIYNSVVFHKKESFNKKN